VRRKWVAFGRRRGPGRPPLAPAVRALILRLARENPRWGYRRIRGELLELGHSVAAATIQPLLRRQHVPPAPPRRPGLAWPAFLRAHAAGLLACDFFTVETVRLETRSALFSLHVHTRRVFVAGYTAHPTGAWVTQHARHICWDLENAGVRPMVLLRDREAKVVPAFDAVFAAQGVRVVRTPVPQYAPPQPTRSPNAGSAPPAASASIGCFSPARATWAACCASTQPTTTPPGHTARCACSRHWGRRLNAPVPSVPYAGASGWVASSTSTSAPPLE